MCNLIFLRFLYPAFLPCGGMHFDSIKMLQSAKVRVIFLISKLFY